MADAKYLNLISRIRTLSNISDEVEYPDDLIETFILSLVEERVFSLSVSPTGTVHLRDFSRNLFPVAATLITTEGTIVEEDVPFTESGVLTPTTSVTVGSSYLASVEIVHLYDAVADIWEYKGGLKEGYIDWKAGQHQGRSSQERDYCIAMAQYFRNKVVRRHRR